MNDEIIEILSSLQTAAKYQRQQSSEQKNKFLLSLAKKIENSIEEILKANQEDLKRLPENTAFSFCDRLTLNDKRIQGMIKTIQGIAELPDPVNEIVENKVLANGLRLKRIRAPLGVLFMIFESRPNVILEAFSLAFKSGNALLLRGGSESRSTAHVIYKLIKEHFTTLNNSKALSFYGLEDYDRKWIEYLLQRKEFIDVVIPRGGENLINLVQQKALMPIIKNDRGLCHTYVDKDADLEMALKIVVNAKTQRPGVCNALETVLIHKDIARQFLPKLYKETDKFNLQWNVDSYALELLKEKSRVQLASKESWDTEYLDFIINCRVVSNLEEAVSHIDKHGSKHSEAIITQSERNARFFQEEIDAAAVYWNASTRFTDGFEFGLGGELGISTQKLHVRGPVGLQELTTPRWIIDGTGHIRC